jgi:hypothetical protein
VILKSKNFGCVAQLEYEYFLGDGTLSLTPTSFTFLFNYQVVLNWLVCQGNVVPIPGAKNAEQAREFAGALGWSLTEQEVEELRSMAREVKPVIGFPVERL